MKNKIPPINILVADDQHDILRSAELLFKAEGMSCITCDSPKKVMETLANTDVDLAILDLNYKTDTTSGTEGFELIKQIKLKYENLPIVVMTAWASVEIAVQAMKLGANDFITKPWDVERLLNIINTQLSLSKSLQRQAKLESENQILRAAQKTDLQFKSAQMQQILQTFNQISASDASVFITGDNGTGKSRLAQICHDLSTRAKEPFISVNMGALAESVFESEMFGHEKGSFTGAHSQRIGRFELADGGTLFLDEIANISEKQQAALLRLVETGEFERIGSSKTRHSNVRIICATNADLMNCINQGTFRRDLFYRINTVTIDIPSLKNRKDDILPLADYFLATHKAKYNKATLAFNECAQTAMLSYDWPGNVRELDHAIERAALLAIDNKITIDNLAITNTNPTNVTYSQQGEPNTFDLDGLTLADVEQKMLEDALIKYMRKPDDAAKALGISRSAFYRKLAKYGFDLS